MSNEIVAWLKAELTKFRPEIKIVENEGHAIVSASISYIEKNGLQAVYGLATALLTGAATGTPWATLMASLLAQAETAGITIAKGAESIVLGQAQADLIAAGTLIAPSTGAVVTPAA